MTAATRKASERAYPELLTADESKALLSIAEGLWMDLNANNIGGYSGGNRPFWILSHFKQVIEQFGHRDVGQTWSLDDLNAHPDKPVSK